MFGLKLKAWIKRAIAALGGGLPRPRPAPPPPRPAPPPPDPDPVGPGDSAAVLAALFALQNAERSQAGVPLLVRDARLDRAAQIQAIDCAKLRELGHIGIDGSDLDDRLGRLGFPPMWAGENAAMGRTPAEAMAAWTGSPAHMRTLADRAYTHGGVGVADGGETRWWVGVFGRLA